MCNDIIVILLSADVEEDKCMLSNEQIAELKNRIDRSRKIRSAKPNGRIVERSRRSGRSTDTKLLGQ